MPAVGYGRNHIGNARPLYKSEVSARKYRLDKKSTVDLLKEIDDVE